jgi:hypothetical protein
MSLRRVILHASVWLCVFALWLWLTRDFHPTWTIAVCATAIVTASALAVYLNALVLRPRFARRRWVYVISVCALVLALDLAAVLSIGAVYDWLWRPDPLRFGFWFNMLSDGFIILLHLLVATWIARQWRGKTLARPTES